VNRLFTSFLTFLIAAVVARAQSASITADAPAEGIKLLQYSDAGYRSSMLRGTKARYVDKNHVDVTDMTLTLFTGDQTNTVDTMLLSPLARASLEDKEMTVHGDGTVRLIRTDDFEVTGEQWTFNGSGAKKKKLFINKNVHVIIHAELQDLLK
jgi:hypothetical protein